MATSSAKRRLFIIVCLCLLPTSGYFVFRNSGAPRPNVLVITVDTLRADHLGSYGYKMASTPNIDALAAEGVLYRNAVCSAPITLPSHCSIMTGLYPPAHGVRDNGTFALGDDAVTLADRLKAEGYETQAFVSALVLDRRYNLSKGFDGYDDNLWAEDAPKLFMIRKRPGNKTIDRVTDWIEKWSGREERKPFFVWVHLFDPHQPYNAPTWARALAPTPYDAEITFVDRQLGRLFDALRAKGVLDNTLIVFTADHGESLGEHQEKTHAIFIYDATVRVPLIIRYPRLFPKGSTYEGPVRSVDIAPTVLSALKLPGGNETQGIDLLPPTVGKVPQPDLPQYSESLLCEVGFGMAPLYGIREGRYKLIRAPKPELYDLRADPAELNNLYSADPDRAAALDQDLQSILESRGRTVIAARDNPMDRETLEMLQSLGYLHGGRERKSMGGMDPKDGITIYNKFENARHLAQTDRWNESESVLREILDAMPGHISARNILALVLLKQGRLDDAVKEYRRSLQDDLKQSRVFAMLGNIALYMNDLAGAEGYYKEALKITPQFIEAVSNMGMIELLRNNEKGAMAWYDKAAELDPNFPHVNRRIADVYYERQEYAKALEYYKKTLERLPTDFRALVQAGNCARAAGHKDVAVIYYGKAQSLRPDSWIPDYNLACLRAMEGNSKEAMKLLENAANKGFAGAGLAGSDQDLASLRELPEFTTLLARMGSIHQDPEE